MAFSYLFCCCRKRSLSSDSLDENTRLILPTDEDLPPSNDFAGSIVDQQDLRDKWTSIVRAKEGKMVNVNAILPFNLHNQPLPEHDYSVSSSRSPSRSTDRYGSTSRNPYAPQAGPSRMNGMLAPSPLHRTMDLPETSTPRPTRSHSDLRSGMTSDEGGGGTGLERHVRSPLLGLRLVRPDGAPVSPTSSIEAGRGRAGWSGAGSEDGTSSQSQRAGGDDDEMTPRPPGIITQVIKLDMDDVGPISVSWSD